MSEKKGIHIYVQNIKQHVRDEWYDLVNSSNVHGVIWDNHTWMVTIPFLAKHLIFAKRIYYIYIVECVSTSSLKQNIGNYNI
jgi:hypothetical protein